MPARNITPIPVPSPLHIMPMARLTIATLPGRPGCALLRNQITGR